MLLLPLIVAAANALSYPPKSYHLVASQESPKHTFRVETYEDVKDSNLDDGALRCVWIVAHNGTRAELLVGPKALSQLYGVDVFISSDERWIRWEQELYHPANAASLYERSAGISYKELGPPIFSEQAWHFMSKQTRHRFTTTDGDHVIRISDWPTPGSRRRKLALYDGDHNTAVTAPNDHSLLILLSGDDGITHVNLWYCFYDLKKHRFFLTAALLKRNRGSVGPSREK